MSLRVDARNDTLLFMLCRAATRGVEKSNCHLSFVIGILLPLLVRDDFIADRKEYGSLYL